ncbi:MAK10-like protein [Tanacetum coccineum]
MIIIHLEDDTVYLTDYQSAQDREPRTRTKPLRFRDESNMVAYAFVAVEEEDTHEPLIYQEAVACENSSKWKAAMKEEMDSLRKNKTLELVDHLVGQKLVGGSWIHTEGRLRLGLPSLCLKKEFDMKELEEAKKILDNGKSVKMSLGGHFKLLLKDCLVRDYDVARISKVPYANAVGSLMYLMVCTRLDIAYAVFSIWKAFGGNTCDLGSFGEETDKTTDLHQHLSRISTQKLETASQITRDAVTTHTKTTSQDLMTAIKTLMRARCMRLSLPAKSRTSNWLERLPAGSITTWEDLTTRFLAQFFPPGRTTKLRMDSRTIDQSADGKLRDRNAKELWALLEDLALYDNESWNDPRDFAKPVKAIALPQDVPMNKINTSCEICSGPHDTQYCMEDPEQAFFEYASSRTDEAGDARLSKFEADFKQQQSEMTNKIDTVLKAITDRIAVTLPSDTVKNPKLSTYPVLSTRSYPTEDPQCSTQTYGSINAITIHTEQQSAFYNNEEKENKKEEDNPENIHVSPSTLPNPSVTFITEKVLKFNSFFESLGLVPPSSNTELICTKEEDSDVMFIEVIPKDDNSSKEEPKADGQEVEYFDIFLTRSELAYHKYLMCGPMPLIFLRNPIIMEGCPSNLKIPCNIGHVHVEKAYIDLNSPLNIMTRMMYNWIMRKKLNPRENVNGGDISSIIDPRLSQVVLGKPFVEISNMTHDPPKGVVRFTNGNNEVAYKMPHKIEQYDSLSDLEKEHTKSVYLRNEEDKRRGVEYLMSKILGFYKECLEL